jgi:hypothetical protein
MKAVLIFAGIPASSIILTVLMLRRWYKPPGKVIHFAVAAALISAVLWTVAEFVFLGGDGKAGGVFHFIAFDICAFWSFLLAVFTAYVYQTTPKRTQ